jgi:TatD DNase family protein
MNRPQPGDYINIHSHGANSAKGIFTIENIMAHESILPSDKSGIGYSYGIHPWFLNENNYPQLIASVREIANNTNILIIGESGFDKLKGPSMELQVRAFQEQVSISEEFNKPMFIHCVRAWEELLAAQKKIRPRMPWMVHGFTGSKELAEQLISKGMYISFWFDFIIRPVSSALVKKLPKDRIFLETDGADIDIRDIYKKVSVDLEMKVEELKSLIFENYCNFFNVKS